MSGPHVVPVYEGKKGRIVRSVEADAFFAHQVAQSKKRGCYVFAMRSGGGITPTYVGKAVKSFGQECFAPHKLSKCNETLVDYDRGTLVIFFFEAPGNHRAPAKQIALLENFLIQTALSVNPSLLNVKGTKQEQWSIRGLVRSTATGRLTKAAQNARRMLSL